MSQQRFRIEITGRVQGVGFRPTVYRYAKEFGLNGWVSNGPEGVTIEAQGETESMVNFIERLRGGLPAHSSVNGFHVDPIPSVTASESFEIRRSRSIGGIRTTALVPADLALCPDCRADVLDPNNRRYLYPFTNCTRCGPRFSIVTRVPYDRSQTTMSDFAMCPNCRVEYDDPENRRFHAQPNACPVCGPAVTWISGQRRRRGAEAIQAAAGLLSAGGIVAVQSIGGFHIACDARQKHTVQTLRIRKRRPHKPLAVMAADLAAAKRIAKISPEAERMLSSDAAPIVMVPSVSPFLEWLAPGLARMGIVLPYTPLHLALFHELARVGGPDLLVMTSGNPPGEPICRTPEEALVKLESLATGFLVHNRRIHNRCDDSVVTVRKSAAHSIRHARGYVPDSIDLGVSGPVIFAAGADLKSAACITRGREAFLTQYIGDLGHLPNETYYIESIDRMTQFLGVKPDAIVHDLHPDMVSTRKAQELSVTWGVPPGGVHPVQHHHAHVAAAMAEHRLAGPVIGVAFDGAGYGTDGTVWGGEFFSVTGAEFTRVGHLLPVSQPGADKAAVEIWRMGISWMTAAYGPDPVEQMAHRLFDEIEPASIDKIARICRRPDLSVTTSSVGRLFDAFAAIADLRSEVTYEGQAAMELEAAYDDRVEGEYEIRLRRDASGIVLDPRPAIRAAVDDRRMGAPASVIAARFHRGLATAAVAVCEQISEQTGVGRVVLGGGVFQNMRFLDLISIRMRAAGLECFAPERIPANDGGIALGQAWILANQYQERR